MDAKAVKSSQCWGFTRAEQYENWAIYLYIYILCLFMSIYAYVYIYIMYIG